MPARVLQGPLVGIADLGDEIWMVVVPVGVVEGSDHCQFWGYFHRSQTVEDAVHMIWKQNSLGIVFDLDHTLVDQSQVRLGCCSLILGFCMYSALLIPSLTEHCPLQNMLRP